MLAARQMNQATLARQTGIGPAVVSLICNDRVLPTPLQKKTIKDALDWPEQADTAFAILTDQKESAPFVLDQRTRATAGVNGE